MFAVAKKNVDGEPLTITDGAVSAANNKVVFKPLDTTDYAYVEYTINGIPQSHYETEFILRGYIFDGDAAKLMAWLDRLQ